MRRGRPLEGWPFRRLSGLVPVFVAGVVGWAGPSSCPVATRQAPEADTLPEHTAGADDPRVRAFLDAYGTMVDSVSFADDDIVFTLAGQRIHFRDGRMLREARLRDADLFDTVFYLFPLGPLARPPTPADRAHYSADVLAALFGTAERQIRTHCRSVSFLGHRLFVNRMIVGPLREVEREIRAVAAVDPAVRAWIADLQVTYSFIFRRIAGSLTSSLHRFGLALDLVPSSFGGRHVYWRWSRAMDRKTWARIPLSQRWSPPQAVIRAFEKNGFVWGGKWAHFDAIHFEYRPEIIIYNRGLPSPRHGPAHVGQ